MRQTSIICAGVLLCASSAMVLADPPAEQAKEEKLICKRDANTGSRFPGKRICRTADQWQREADEARRVTEEMQHLRHGPKGS